MKKIAAIIKNELRLSGKFLIIWMGFVLLLCGFAYFEYLSLRDSLDELAGTVRNFPKILMIMFGVSEELTSPLGWYGCIYFWTAILDYSYAVCLGVSCVAKEIQQGTAEYLFTRPISRGQIVMAKAACGGINLLALSAFSGVCSYFTAVLPLGGLEQKGAVLNTTIGLFLTELVLFSLALLASGAARSYKGAVRMGCGMLLGFYGVYIAAEYLEISALFYLTPLKYFDVYAVAKSGFDVCFVIITVVIVAFSVITARKIWGGKEMGGVRFL